MAAKAKHLPYPTSPKDVPDGLTDFSTSHVNQQNKLLAGLFVFLILYITMVIFLGMFTVWCALTLAKWPLFKMVGLAFGGIFFVFLVKGFFKRKPMEKESYVEIKEDDQPLLFQFIEKLCEEVGAPLPNRVFVSFDVNAACIRRVSLVNLFVEPKRDLLIGLGLVNSMNLSEFKAVLAHEFGHFCQSGHTTSYTYVVLEIIGDMVRGEDWFDRILKWMRKKPAYRRTNNGAANIFRLFAMVVGGILDGWRAFLIWLFERFALQNRALAREREFHADKVAVSVAGSDAATHGLLRARFGMQCFIQAVNDLVVPARDNKQYSNDVYLHQDRAAAIVRRNKKDETLGLPPALPAANSGKGVRVFDAEQDELEDQDTTPPMWRTHPPDADREENAKDPFVPAVMDHRSSWILFTDAADLRERLTYRFYRSVFEIPKNSDLMDAQQIQEYIDNEYADTTYDPKYHGAYDDRIIEPGELAELNALVHDSPWAEDRMLKVYDKLFEGCRQHAEEHHDGHKELSSLKENVIGKPSPKMKRMIEQVEKKLEANREWFKSYDRRVYLLHVQMAAQVDEDLRSELVERYRFQLEVQRFYQEARYNYDEANMHLSVYGAAARGEVRVPRDFPAQVIAVLRAAWKSLKKILQSAREINLPAMKNFEEGDRLADFILEGKLVPEPPLSELKGVWVQKLMNQLRGVRNRCLRVHFKSLGGILSLQEKIAAKWLAVHRPGSVQAAEGAVAAEVIEDAVAAEVIEDAVAAEVIEEAVPAQVVEEAVSAEVVSAEVHELGEAEVLPLDEQSAPAQVVELDEVEVLPLDEPAQPAPAGAKSETVDHHPVEMAAFQSPSKPPPLPPTSTGTPSASKPPPTPTGAPSALKPPPLPAVTPAAVVAAPGPPEADRSVEIIPDAAPVAETPVEITSDMAPAAEVAEASVEIISDASPVAESRAAIVLDAVPAAEGPVEIIHDAAPAVESPIAIVPDAAAEAPGAAAEAPGAAAEAPGAAAEAPGAAAEAPGANVPDAPPVAAVVESQPAPAASTEIPAQAFTLDASAQAPPVQEPQVQPLSVPQPTQPSEPMEEVFSLEVHAAPASKAVPQPAKSGPAAPVPVEEVFSLDADDAPSPAPKPAAKATPPKLKPVKPAKPEPAKPAVARSEPAKPAPAKPGPAKRAPAPAPVPSDEEFSLEPETQHTIMGEVIEELPHDGGQHTIMGEVIEELPHDGGQHTIMGEVIEELPLDGGQHTIMGEVIEELPLDGGQHTIMGEVIELDDAPKAEEGKKNVPAKPTRPPFKPAPVSQPSTKASSPAPTQASGIVSAPAPKSTTADLPEPAPTASGTLVPASGKRPPLRITFVRPGQKSPFAK